MDYLRSCYTTEMRFFRDEPNAFTAVKWYFVPRDRPTIPFPHVFGSRVWERDQEQLRLGEMQNVHDYYNGRDTCHARGRTFCGSEIYWLNGAWFADPLPPIDPVTHLPACCGLIGTAAVGGQAEGGESRMPFVVKRRGGQAEGGDSLVSQEPGLTGGQAEGGDSLVSQEPGLTGGQAEGGEGVVIGGVPTDCCEEPLPLVIVATDFLDICACYPPLYFVWDGTGWQCQTSASECAGVDTLAWRITLNEEDCLLHIDWEGVEGDLEFECSPFSASFGWGPPVAPFCDNDDDEILWILGPG